LEETGIDINQEYTSQTERQIEKKSLLLSMSDLVKTKPQIPPRSEKPSKLQRVITEPLRVTKLPTIIVSKHKPTVPDKPIPEVPNKPLPDIPIPEVPYKPLPDIPNTEVSYKPLPDKPIIIMVPIKTNLSVSVDKVNLKVPNKPIITVRNKPKPPPVQNKPRLNRIPDIQQNPG